VEIVRIFSHTGSLSSYAKREDPWRDYWRS
jgi:hypothetical protein